MKRRTTWAMILQLCILAIGQVSLASAANLQLGITQAPASGSSAAVIGIISADDVESFSLTMNFSSGTVLSLVTAGWYTRHQYLPASLFGPSPQVDRNLIQTPSLSKKVYLNGFAPSGTSGDVGIVTFNISSGAVTGDTHILSLTGEYLSKSTGKVQNFPTVTTTFIVGPYPTIITGDINNDGTVDLKDTMISLQILTGVNPSQIIYKNADVNADNKIGLHEAIYTIRKAANQP